MIRSPGVLRRSSNGRDPLAKALRVLALFADSPNRAWGARELAKVAGIAPSTAHRLLNVLVSNEVLSVDPRSRYTLSRSFFRIAWKIAAALPLKQHGIPIMEELVRDCGETVLLALYDPGRMEMMFIASVDSPHPIRQIVELDEWLPVHVGASGLAIMAFLPPDERRAIVASSGLRPMTGTSITDPKRLEDEIAKIRRRGYALSIGQRTPGTVGLAAPIWGPDRRVLGSLVITTIEQRFDPALEPRLARLVMENARRLTSMIGGEEGGETSHSRVEASASPITP